MKGEEEVSAEATKARPSPRKKRVPFPDKMRTKPIDIFEAWCKNCGLCIAFCPAEVFAFLETGKVIVQSPEKCKQCGMCANLCPDMAILLLPKIKKGQ